MTDSLMSGVILPLTGIGIIIFCILSFLLPYGEKFRDKTQKVKGFGLDLEVSVLTLLILIGVSMSLTGVYLQICDYKGQLDEAIRRRYAAEDALSQTKKMEMKILVTLENAGEDDIPNLCDVKSRDRLTGR